MEQGSVRVSYGGTFGLPGYSSGKFDVSVDLPIAPKETVEKAIDRAWKLAQKGFENQVEAALDGVEEHLRGKK